MNFQCKFEHQYEVLTYTLICNVDPNRFEHQTDNMCIPPPTLVGPLQSQTRAGCGYVRSWSMWHLKLYCLIVQTLLSIVKTKMVMYASVRTKRLDLKILVKLAPPAYQNGYLYLFFVLQSVVDQMWNCNKDL